MDACLMTFLVGVICIMIIILIILLGRRPKLLCSIQNHNTFSFRQEAINKIRTQGYIIKEKKNDNIFVQKDAFSATTLVFKQNGPDVDVLFIHSNSTGVLAAIIILIFTIWVIAIILAVIADSKSKNFRENELKPLLTGYGKTGRRCPNCGRPIPFDANICPYCALRF
jgi:hypothetical protein